MAVYSEWKGIGKGGGKKCSEILNEHFQYSIHFTFNIDGALITLKNLYHFQTVQICGYGSLSLH